MARMVCWLALPPALLAVVTPAQALGNHCLSRSLPPHMEK